MPKTKPEDSKKSKAPAFKIPKEPGAWADLLFTIRAEKAKLTKKIAEPLEILDEQERQLREHIIANLPKSLASGVAGKLARVSVVTKPQPTLKDKAKLYAHIKKTGDFDLLGGLNGPAVKERWADKKKVPGVHVYNAVTVSLSAL